MTHFSEHNLVGAWLHYKRRSLEGPIEELPFELPEDAGDGFLSLREQQVQRVQPRNELGKFEDQKQSQWCWL